MFVGTSLLYQLSEDWVAVNQCDMFGSRPGFRERRVQPLPESSPTSYLDKAIVRVGVLRARELVMQGYSADEACRIACPGSWSQWRAVVRQHLERAEQTQ
jgi:hypothetical protein